MVAEFPGYVRLEVSIHFTEFRGQAAAESVQNPCRESPFLLQDWKPLGAFFYFFLFWGGGLLVF